jgi:excisionase family DNA binding protein
MEPVLLRIQEAAKLLKVSKWTIYRWIEEGRLRATKIGRGSLRVFRTSLNELVGKHEVKEWKARDARSRTEDLKKKNNRTSSA